MFGVHWARKDRPETHFSSHVFNHQGSVRVEHCLGSACSKRKSPCPPHLTTRRKGGWFRFVRVFNRCCLPMFHWPLEEHRMRAWPLNHLKSCSAQLSQNCGKRQSTAFSVSPVDLHVTLTLLHPQIYCSLVFLPTRIKQLLEISMLIEFPWLCLCK